MKFLFGDKVLADELDIYILTNYFSRPKYKNYHVNIIQDNFQIINSEVMTVEEPNFINK